MQVGGCATWETIASLAVLARFRVRGGGTYARWAHETQQRVSPDLVRELWLRVAAVSPPPPSDSSTPDFGEAFGGGDLPSLLDEYWCAAVEPYWTEMAETVRAEVRRRNETLVARGWVAMLSGIDAHLRWRPPLLASPHQEDIRHVARGRRLRLVPLVFGGAWSLFTALPVGAVAVSYALPAGQALQGLPGTQACVDTEVDPLAILLGRRRALILRCLDRPATTTTLSAALGIAPSTTSEHLRELLEAGVVRRTRRGNEVFYELDRSGFTLMAEFS